MLLGTAQAQSVWSNQRSRLLEIRNGCYELDSLTVIPASVVLKNPATGERVGSLLYRIADNQICFSRSDTSALSLRIDFRVLPYRLGAALFRIDSSSLVPPEDRILRTATYNPYAASGPAGLGFGGLQYNGSFARGLSFGNSQDLVLNSNFNLQMAGRLGDGLEIVAAITDENIPLQPEGNTRQLREFDRVFVQLSKGKGKLVAGDYDLLRPQSYFMNYFKRLQGLSFRIESQDAGKGLWRGDAALAISRGQFARNLIAQQEGNQGPYRLRGNAGELFIIVLAGTEKVWLDGRLMERGIETDYVIDYNRGEITFTNKRLITKDSRIIVEFEYADQGYLRSLYAFNAEYVRPKSRLYANVFSQQDSRTSTGISPLSAEQRSVLRNAGDDFTTAVSSGIDSIAEFLPFRAQYRLTDTLSICGERDTVLVFSTDPALARYTARFSFVGQGRGNYVLDPTLTANERVYRWVEPDPLNCLPRGDYEPVVQLTAPQQQQLFTLGAEQRFSKQSLWRTELALSRKDLNRFSDLDNKDDLGTALFSSLRHQLPLGKNATDTSGTRLELAADYEWVQRHFKALNPYRSPEFQRDWSLTDIQGLGNVQAATENLGRANLAFRRSGWGVLQYGFAAFLRGSVYRGSRHTAQLDLLRKGWEMKAEGSWLEAVNAGQRNSFVRPRLRLSRSFEKLGGWRAGIYAERERNERRLLSADTLEANSFFYDLQKAFIESPAGKENFVLGAHFQRRQDYAPAGADFVRNTRATELNLNGSRNIRRVLQWAGNFTWRRLEVQDPARTTQQPAETFLARTDLGITLWKGAFRSNTTYEIGSGQEPRLEFTYIRVRQGEGTHIWLDSLNNNDGIIQPNEMEPAPFSDLADFVRVPTVSNEFIRADYVNLLQSWQLEPRAIWFNTKGWKQFLSKFALQSSIKTGQRTRSAPGVQTWNPLQWNIPDTALVAGNAATRHLLFFNRAHPKWDLQAGISDVWNKTVQTTGFEDRRNREQFLRGRLNLSKPFSALATATWSRRSSDSEFFNNRDFDIAGFALEPQLNWQPARQFRLTARYKFQTDFNQLPGGGEQSERHDLSAETAFNKAGAWALRSRFSYIRVAFDGAANSPVGFAILNGLQRGNNWLWNIGLDRQLAKNLQLSIQYEGRQTGAGRMVHVGRASVGAVF
ncbi:MAG TPA: hypothetical protein PLZ12_14205 [Saprospiraceae bacterium]|nr:hypothetical protein [Saprospiraceae bacterium]